MDTTNTNASAIAGKPETITAAELVEHLLEWATLKDAGKINLLWKNDHIDGIGKVGERYVIQYGGIVNDPDYVNGDTPIPIEWLSAATASPAPTGEGGAEDGVTIICADEEPVDYGSAEYWRMLYDAEQYKMFRATRTLGALQQQNAVLTSELEAARGQVAGLVKALEALRDDPEAKVAKDFDVFMATQERDVKFAVQLAVYDTKYQISQSAKAALEAAQALTADGGQE